MAINVLVTATEAGNSSGPFEIRETNSTGAIVASNVTRTSLLSGFTVSVANGTTVVYVGVTSGPCLNTNKSATITLSPTPSPTPTPAPTPAPTPSPTPSPTPAPSAPGPSPTPTPSPTPSPTPAPSAPGPTPTPSPTPAPTPAPSAPTCATILLKFSSVGGNNACTEGSTLYYANNGTFCSASILYTDSGCSTLAPIGYYSDGVNYRYWNQASLLACAACSTPSPTPTPAPTPAPTVTYYYWLVERCDGTGSPTQIRTTNTQFGVTAFSIKYNSVCYEVAGGGSGNTNTAGKVYQTCTECELD